jgi:large subunit ribosomal protein L9
MKVYLLKNVERIGVAGELIKVADGYAKNFLFPNKLAVEVKPENEKFYEQRAKHLENRKEVVATETSMLSEQINGKKFTLKKKVHDDDKLYAAINASEVVEVLQAAGIKVSKSQILFDKSIKSIGTFSVTIKLSSRLQPVINLQVTR